MLARALQFIGRQIDRILLIGIRRRLRDPLSPLADEIFGVLERVVREQERKNGAVNEFEQRRKIHAVR